MAILGASFQIGRSALAAYQTAVTITGQNIANVGNADYTRQSGRLAAMYGGMTAGTGVRVSALERHIDTALESRLRLSLADKNAALTRYQTLSQVEALYNELTETDLSTQLSSFFGSFTTLQTDPLDTSSRELVISNAQTVIGTIQRQRDGLLDQVDTLNETTRATVTEINSIASQIADLNELIVTQEASSPGSASALRDDRDALLRDLGELTDVRTKEQSNGVMNVYVGSEPLVDFNIARELTADTSYERGFEQVEVRFTDSGAPLRVNSGQLAALESCRDEDIATQIDSLDQLSKAIIWEVNRVHTSGSGLAAYTAIDGSYSVSNADAAFNTTGGQLDFPVTNGSFQVQIRDEVSGQIKTHLVEVDLDGLKGDDMSLSTLAKTLDELPNLNASVTADNRLQLTTDDGYEVTFADDTSGVLAALGVGTFFEGNNAATIAVRSEIEANPQLIATSLSGADGDGGNAGRLAAALATSSDLLSGNSVQSFQEAMVNRLAVDTAAAETDYTAADSVHSSLLAQRESISGVDLDEEAINLTMYERSFQGASRFLTVVESLSAEILSLLD